MRGEVAIGPSVYGVYVIDGSLCSRVYGIAIYTVVCGSYTTCSLQAISVGQSAPGIIYDFL